MARKRLTSSALMHRRTSTARRSTFSPPSRARLDSAMPFRRARATPGPVPGAPVAGSSPDYGMSAFLWGHPDTTSRDLKLVSDAGFRWQKSLFQWRQIEGACKGCFDWTEADRVVKASTSSGVQIVARLDFQPPWARKDGAR